MEVNHFAAKEMTLSYLLSVRLGGPPSRSGPFGEEKYIGRFGNRNQDGLAHSLSHCTDYDIPAFSYWIDLYYSVAQQSESGLGQLIVEVSRLHRHTPHPVGLL